MEHNNSNTSKGSIYVTYKWLLTTILASTASILLLVGAIANTTFYPKTAGAAMEEKLSASDKRLTEMNATLTEVRQDIKVLIARGNTKHAQ